MNSDSQCHEPYVQEQAMTFGECCYEQVGVTQILPHRISEYPGLGKGAQGVGGRSGEHDLPDTVPYSYAALA